MGESYSPRLASQFSDMRNRALPQPRKTPLEFETVFDRFYSAVGIF
jgi:hypothetical protein